MKNKLAAALLGGLLCLTTGAATKAQTVEDVFLTTIEGQWKGNGEVVAGKFQGTKFYCDFSGLKAMDVTGMTLDGHCRVGLFRQPMKAVISKQDGQFIGTFNDGAKSIGLDVVSGKIGDNHMVFALNRKQLNGAMMARLQNDNTMHITVSVKVEDQLIPVVGMNLKRSGPVSQTVAHR